MTTSQNATAPKRGVEPLVAPVGLTTSQNATAPKRSRKTAQGNGFDYQSECHCSKTPRMPWNQTDEFDYQSECHCSKTPCQSFSVAGGREGLDGASGLMWEYVRAVRELRPRWLLWENVPGASSSRTRDAAKGDDYRCLLSALDDLGYGMAWDVLDAQFFGVAQRRRRLFVVGRLGDPWSAAEVLFEPESLRWDSPTGKQKRQELAELSDRGAGGSYTLKLCHTGSPFDYQSECHCSKTSHDVEHALGEFDYQSECHCSKTTWGIWSACPGFDYQSECHCSKTQGETEYCVKGLTTSQNATAPKPLPQDGAGERV